MLTRPPIELIRGASLFLDFDGTLVDLTDSPDAVVVSSALRYLLARLDRGLEGRLVILTGRASADVSALIKPVEVLVGGSHGLELIAPDLKSGDRAALLEEIAGEFRQLERIYPGVLVEQKPLGVALHFRQAPEAEEACRTAASAAAEHGELELQPGKMVFELKLAGGNKGDAVRSLMAKAPFAGTRPVFVGDDLTDEAGFQAARELGGSAILVGEMRETAANYRIHAVADVVDWLSQAAERLE